MHKSAKLALRHGSSCHGLPPSLHAHCSCQAGTDRVRHGPATVGFLWVQPPACVRARVRQHNYFFLQSDSRQPKISCSARRPGIRSGVWFQHEYRQQQLGAIDEDRRENHLVVVASRSGKRQRRIQTIDRGKERKAILLPGQAHTTTGNAS